MTEGNLLLNLRSPRDCGSCRSRLWYFLSPLDGASVHEAHCAQASTVNLVELIKSDLLLTRTELKIDL